MSDAKPEATKDVKQVVGILGGTFDPIHFGHLRCAVELQEQLELDQLRLIPCHRPVHRDQPQTASHHRLAMVNMALASEPDLERIVVDDRELKADRPSYSVDTLFGLRQELGDEVSLVMAVGTDAYAALSSWHRWQDLLSLCHIVIMQRPGTQLPKVSTVEGDLLQQHGVDSPGLLKKQAFGCILPWQVTALDISATQIRSLVQSGKSIQFLLPSAISGYINQYNLYNAS